MSQDHNDPVWFVTGSSSGFGRELVAEALSRGWKVAASAREVDKLEPFVRQYGDRILPLRLDVTRSDLIEAAVAAAEKRFGRIDVLVNCAGYGYLAAVEEGEDPEIRAMFDTNFFGLAEMVRTVLPGMRRRGRGYIVNFSSAGGFIGFPGSGYYAASKFAVEGLSEALAKEVESLGIKVLLVEPGPFRTDWAGRSLHQSPVYMDAYEPTAGTRRRSIAANSGKQPGDPQRGARIIIQAVTSAKPPFRLLLGRAAIENVRRKLQSVWRELDAWEAVATDTDYPVSDTARQPGLPSARPVSGVVATQLKADI